MLFAVVPYALGATPAFTTGAPSTSGMVSYWNMQGNSNDVFGSNNGTDTSVSYSTSYGKVAQGASYNGTSGYSSMGNVLGFEYNQPWSIAFWMYNKTSGVSNIISKQQGNGYYNGYGIGTQASGFPQIFLYNGAGGGGFQNNFPSAYTNTWTFIVATYDGSDTNAGIKGYTNGSLVSLTNTQNVPLSISILSTTPFQLSGRGGTGNLWTGYLDEPLIYSRVLSSTEVSQLYNLGMGETLCNVTGGPVCGGGSSSRHKVIIVSFYALPKGHATVQIA